MEPNSGNPDDAQKQLLRNDLPAARLLRGPTEYRK